MHGDPDVIQPQTVFKEDVECNSIAGLYFLVIQSISTVQLNVNTELRSFFALHLLMCLLNIYFEGKCVCVPGNSGSLDAHQSLTAQC